MPEQKVGNGRATSRKQSEASRANGSKSKGPKSVAGKSKVAQNATREGLFSRQVVIEQLGEKQKDFDDLKKQLWDSLQPRMRWKKCWFKISSRIGGGGD